MPALPAFRGTGLWLTTTDDRATILGNFENLQNMRILIAVALTAGLLAPACKDCRPPRVQAKPGAESAAAQISESTAALTPILPDRTVAESLDPRALLPRRTLEQFGEDVDLSELPRELIYPGAKKLARYGDYSVPRLGPSYNFETRDPLDRIEAHYRRSMAGWTTLKEVKRDTMVWIMYESADKKEVAEYMATRIGDKTALVVIHCRR